LVSLKVGFWHLPSGFGQAIALSNIPSAMLFLKPLTKSQILALPILAG
jgi:hypothetical protein